MATSLTQCARCPALGLPQLSPGHRLQGMSEAKVEKIMSAVQGLVQTGFQTAKSDLARRQSTVLRITTGAPAVDTILGGGVETQSILELHGEFRTGKTALCHALRRVPAPPKGGVGSGALSSPPQLSHFDAFNPRASLPRTRSVTCQLPRDMGGASGKAAYIDTEGTFRPETIVSIAGKLGLDGE